MATATPAAQSTADTARLWLAAPVEAHRLWREQLQFAERSYAEQSTAQYRSLFGRFCVWMAGQGLNLGSVAAADIARFLDGLRGRDGAPASTRTQRMYLAEIDRVMVHLTGLGLRASRPTEVLVDQVRITTRLRPRSIALPENDTEAKVREYTQALLARDQDLDVAVLRDLMAAAIVTAMLHGGLTPKEIQKLRLKSLQPGAGVQLDEVTLRAPGHRLLQDREVVLSGWAAACLVRWWQLRAALVLRDLPPGTRMAPQSAKAFSFTPTSHAVTSRFIYEAVSHLCAQAGAGDDVGPQQLRNLFIANLVRQELPDHEVAARAGLLAVDQIQHMRLATGVRRRRARAVPNPDAFEPPENRTGEP